MKAIITSLGVIVFVAALVAGGTGAFFSDTETSTANVFTAGSIDLSLGSIFSSTANANGGGSNPVITDNAGRALFNFTDLKPGDLGTVVFKLKVTSNEAYACATSTLMTSEENGIVDPETDAGDVTAAAGEGELKNYIQFATFADLDMDGVYDAGVEPINVNQYGGGDGDGFTNAQIFGAGTVPVADPSTPNTWLTIGSLTPNTEYGAGMLYCFGKFTTTGSLNTTQVTGCNGGPIGAYNDAQTDSASGSITFSAVQTRNNENFSCTPRG